MNREKSLKLLRKYIKNENLVRHGLAVEAVMKRLCKYFKKSAISGPSLGGEDEIEKWTTAGLLHDIDWELTAKTPEEHGKKAAEILKEEGYEKDVIRAIKVHNYTLELPLETLMEKVLFCTEELTGLITACALVNPKKLSGVKVSSVKKKFKQPSFARGVDRKIIAMAPDLIGLSLEELIELSLEAMMEIKTDLGL